MVDDLMVHNQPFIISNYGEIENLNKVHQTQYNALINKSANDFKQLQQTQPSNYHSQTQCDTAP